jgi:hypothetical protein
MESLRRLFDGEEPLVHMFPDPLAPLVVDYPGATLSIFVVDGRMTISTGAELEAKANREFGRVLESVLEGCGQQVVNAYGFNFDYTLGSVDVRQLLGLPPHAFEVDGYGLRESTGIHLEYYREDVGYNLDLKEGVSSVHVNVHLERRTDTMTLAREISGQLEEWSHRSLEFLAEVTQHDGR